MGDIQRDALVANRTAPKGDLLKLLARYRVPSHSRSVFELFVTGVPFIVLWAGAWWALSISYWLTIAISIPAGVFLVRLFMIQHDCGHGAFFRVRSANDWVGRILGVLTFTPYEVWRRGHAAHHATSGNLDKRGVGDVDTLTVSEYQALPWFSQLLYRFYRHPFILFGIGPAYYFILRNRFPIGISRGDRAFWISAMGTNLGIILLSGILIYFLGFEAFLLVQLPTILVASSIGVWLFYVQHQFEDTYWAESKDWKLQDAALYGSSHYDLPGVLRWLTANIGVHHVHHLASRIPYYRLHQVLVDHPDLANIRRMTIWESFACVKFRLWDENQRKMVTFSEARAMQAT
ncbi:MAG: fatty acid desaturase [Rhizobiales bacterium]|nr:fatty acid desaturase [Hyphomicrobiales bacterium]